MKKLFLLDAMALIYRAHFAFRKNPRINSKGMNTGAVLGFTNSLLEVLQKEKPTHLGVAFDTPEPTFRHIQFKEYKAQREAQPEDISSALPYIFRLVEAFNIPILMKGGYEADDVIGTIAKRAAQDPEFQVFMMTIDKDYGQLVAQNIFLYKPSYLGSDIEILGIKEVLAKWDIKEVMQVTDILGLQGDASDNIPGIPGVGEKTAKKLIQEYGSVESLIQNAHQLKGKLQESVINFAEQGLLSKQLATIDINVPVAYDEEALRWDTFHEEKVKALFHELEFITLTKKLFKEPAQPKAPSVKTNKKQNPQQPDLFSSIQSDSPEDLEPTESSNESNGFFQEASNTVHHYYAINSQELRERLKNQLAKLTEFCFDCETNTLNAYKAQLVGISFCWYAHEAYYVPFPENQEEAHAILAVFKDVFENPLINKIGQNLKYDISVLKNYGIEVQGQLFDTMIAHYLLEPDMRHNMDILSKNYLKYQPIEIEKLIGKKNTLQGNMRDVPLEDIKEYAAEDADVTYQLKQIFAPQIQKLKQNDLLFKIESPLMLVLADMERTGIKVDVDILKEVSLLIGEEIKVIEEKITELAGESFNIASPKQLGEILFEKLQLDPKAKKTKTGQYATGEEVIIKLLDKHPIIYQILEYREFVKLKNTYLDALPLLLDPDTKKIHTSYNQAVAATGRLSSTNPNLQNIPIRTDKGKEIRKAFVPSDQNHIIVSADYSQIELRIMSAFSKDETMLRAFSEGKDIHTATAAKIYKVPIEEVDAEKRSKAKTANFGIIYGISAWGLSQRLNISRKEAGEIIAAYFKEFPAVKQYMDNVVNIARDNEFVETFFGRRRYLRNINSRNSVERGMAERNAINAPIQGTAADMIKMAMIHIHDFMNENKLKSKMVLQVHDELVFDVEKSELEFLKPNIIQLMTGIFPDFPVPLQVEIGVGNNWLEAH